MNGRHLLILFALLTGASVSLTAGSVTYSFFGSAWLQGTNFQYVSPGGFLSFDTGPLTPTTSTDVFFYDINGAFFVNDIGALATFDFVSEDELLLRTTTGCTLDFTLSSGFSHVSDVCPAEFLTGGSSIPGFGYLLNVFTNFDVVGTGELGVTPTGTGGGTGGDTTPEPSTALLFVSGYAVTMLVKATLARVGRRNFTGGSSTDPTV